MNLDVPLPLWGEWFEAVGVADFVPRRIETYDSGQVIYEAAAAGMGLALGAPPLVDSYIGSGRLVSGER